jgi:ABC-2 type transport system ATP-binding protein
MKGIPDMKVVEVNNIVKSYTKKRAVNGLCFSMHQGEIIGLIGPNGAGKSTTIKIMLDFMKPDSGNVKIFGKTLDEAGKNQIGYLPEEKGLYKKLRAMDLIIYLASLKGMDRYSAEKKATTLLEQANMLVNRKKKIKEMSKGMGQMIQFIITIIHDPKLIIMDEPFSGLDPVNMDLVKRMLMDLRDQGKSIILSTHQMNEVEELCDRILMIHNGSSVLYGDLKEIKSRYRNYSVLVDTEGQLGDIAGVIEKKPKKGSTELVLDGNTNPQQIFEQLFNCGMIVNHFEVTTPSLTEIFLKEVVTHDE